MATIHPQRPNETLPSGWESRLDPRTGRYYYINHAEHTTTWEDPRMLHPQVQQKMVEPLPPPADEALVHKLHGYFPNVDIDSIRSLVKKFNNQEHEIIASLVSGSWKGNRFPTTTPSSPKMKLRYLKLVFPEADEAVLFDILYNCDNNAYEASNRLSTMGYKKRDTPIIRPNANQQPKPTAEESRPKKPDRPVIVGPPSISDKHILMARIQEQFPAVSKTLVNMALDSSNYNEERAISFLKAMTPMDGTSHKFPTSESAPVISVPTEETIPSTSTSPVIAVQDGIPKITRDKEDFDGTVTINGVTIEVTEPDIEISISKDTPTPKLEIKGRSKFKRDIMKISRSTSTSEEQTGYTSAYRVKAKGPDSSLRKGPCEDLLLKDYVPWVGADSKNRRGPDTSLHRGPDPKNLGHRESLAKGPCRDHRRGPLADITHALRASRVSDN